MFNVFVVNRDTGNWMLDCFTEYKTMEDAVDDYGEENVRAVVPGQVYTLHEDKRGDTIIAIMVQQELGPGL